jgi:hypothetical protein
MEEEQEIKEEKVEENFVSDPETVKALASQIMKHHGKCKGCQRTEKTYKEFCFWCWIEKVREITQELSSEISNNGRTSLIDIEKMKKIRNKLLELV